MTLPDFIREAILAQGKVDPAEIEKVAATVDLTDTPPNVVQLVQPESLTTTQLRKTQTAVQACFVKHGAMHDEALVAVYQATRLAEGWPQQSESGLRTRRSELVDAEMLRDTGRTVKLQSGRSSIVWNLSE